jgi:hypothetical protein
MDGTKERVSDLERRNAQVVALEAQLPHARARPNVAVTAAHERAYWRERRQLNLNALTLRVWATELVAVARAIRFRLGA